MPLKIFTIGSFGTWASSGAFVNVDADSVFVHIVTRLASTFEASFRIFAAHIIQTMICTNRALVNVAAHHAVALVAHCTFASEPAKSVGTKSVRITIVRAIKAFVNVGASLTIAKKSVVACTCKIAKGVGTGGKW